MTVLSKIHALVLIIFPNFMNYLLSLLVEPVVSKARETANCTTFCLSVQRIALEQELAHGLWCVFCTNYR